jgi:hypothetical protein
MLKWRIRRLLLRFLTSRYLRPDSEDVPLLLSTHNTLGEALCAAGKHSLHFDIPVYVMGPKSISADIRNLEAGLEALASGRPVNLHRFRCVSYAYDSLSFGVICSVTYAACWDD